VLPASVPMRGRREAGDAGRGERVREGGREREGWRGREGEGGREGGEGGR
jgi:hypothetical protein